MDVTFLFFRSGSIIVLNVGYMNFNRLLGMLIAYTSVPIYSLLAVSLFTYINYFFILSLNQANLTHCELL